MINGIGFGDMIRGREIAVVVVGAGAGGAGGGEADKM